MALDYRPGRLSLPKTISARGDGVATEDGSGDDRTKIASSAFRVRSAGSDSPKVVDLMLV
jgi:hypothetical protein